MVKTPQVFTPTKTSHTYKREVEELWPDLSDLAEQGSAFAPVLGVTKEDNTRQNADGEERIGIYRRKS